MMVTEVFNCDPEIETKNVSLYQAIPIKFFYKRELFYYKRELFYYKRVV